MAKQPEPAGWTSYLQLILTIFLVSIVVAGGVFIVKAVNDTVKSTKENLKSKGYTITDNGVSIKTNKRYDRDDYVDATQRGFIKTMSAASFKNVEAEEKKAKEIARKQAKEAEKSQNSTWGLKSRNKAS